MISWWGWVVVALSSVQYALVLGPVYNYSIVLLSFQEEFHTSTSFTGWVGSLAHALVSIGTLPAAVCLRKLSPRVVTFMGIFLYCGGVASTAFVPSLGYVVVTYSVISGLGMSFVVQAGIVLTLAWFPKKYCARATSALMIGTPCGTLISGPVLNGLTAVLGWRHAFLIIASFTLVVSSVGASFLSNPLPGKPSQVPKEITTETEDDDDKQHHVVLEDFELPPFYCHCDPWLWFVGIGIGSLSWGFLATNLASFMNDIGLTIGDVSFAIISISMGDIIGKILISAFLDSLKFLKIFFIAGSFISCGIFSGLLVNTSTLIPVIVLTFLLGLARAAFFGTVIVSAMELFSVYGIETITIITLVPFGIGTLISAPLSGGLFDLTGDYTLSLLVLVFLLTLSTICMLLIPFKMELRSWRMRGRSPDTSPIDGMSPSVDGVNKSVAGGLSRGVDDNMTNMGFTDDF
ncbi:monocarboxylate transporter 13-like [Asterias rubens]|uniref:monocarboxylate transporter 13-like n=1 Tax=Asterias rubens TaxID=7604 RepID=UPI00145555A5|nr:monocarboxylate transporter 13-like [Asterias rubens]